MMKTLFITLNFLWVGILSAQDLIGAKWEINNILGDNVNEEDFYILTKPENPDWSYGDHLQLSTDGNFKSWYSAPCGNDCFTTSYGTYKKISEEYISFHIQKVEHWGDCRDEGEVKKNKTNTYYVYKKSESEIYLLKTTGNHSKDLQKATYAKVLADNIRIIPKDNYSSFGNITLPSKLTCQQRADNYTSQYLKLTNYELCVTGSKDFILVYLVKDLDKNAYYYIVERPLEEGYGLFHYTEDQVKELFRDYYEKRYGKRK